MIWGTAFQIKVGLGAGLAGAGVDLGVRGARVRAFQHRGVGGAGIEPHLQDVGALRVGRRVGAE
ncbi:MAG: hypothetical protein ABW051_09720, partial [Burkholderiaceae bacterium]